MNKIFYAFNNTSTPCCLKWIAIPFIKNINVFPKSINSCLIAPSQISSEAIISDKIQLSEESPLCTGVCNFWFICVCIKTFVFIIENLQTLLNIILKVQPSRTVKYDLFKPFLLLCSLFYYVLIRHMLSQCII